MSKGSRRLRRGLVGVLVFGLALAAGIVWIWHGPSSRYAADQRPPQGLQVVGQVPDFSLTERSGQEVRLSHLRGKVWVAMFFFSRCQDTCPVQTARMASLQAEFAGASDLRLTREVTKLACLNRRLAWGFALAVVLISLARGFNADLFAILFGSILTVSPADVWLILGLGAVVRATLARFSAQFFAISLNEDLARTSGVPVAALNLLLIILTAVSTVIAMRMVGVLLVSAISSCPPSPGSPSTGASGAPSPSPSRLAWSRWPSAWWPPATSRWRPEGRSSSRRC